MVRSGRALGGVESEARAKVGGIQGWIRHDTRGSLPVVTCAQLAPERQRRGVHNGGHGWLAAVRIRRRRERRVASHRPSYAIADDAAVAMTDMVRDEEFRERCAFLFYFMSPLLAGTRSSLSSHTMAHSHADALF